MLLTWAVGMFLSGTGAVVALEADSGVKEATINLCMRILLPTLWFNCTMYQ